MSDVRRITVVECKPRTYGKSHERAGQIIEGVTNGTAWRIHSVSAVDDTGLPIQDKMTAFRQLPVGETIMAKFTEKNDPKFGLEYTVEMVGGPAPNSSVTGSTPSQPVSPLVAPDELEMEREARQKLADRVRVLEDAVRAAGIIPAMPGTDVPAPVQAAVSVGAATAQPVDDDDDKIPF